MPRKHSTRCAPNSTVLEEQKPPLVSGTLKSVAKPGPRFSWCFLVCGFLVVGIEVVDIIVQSLEVLHLFRQSRIWWCLSGHTRHEFHPEAFVLVHRLVGDLTKVHHGHVVVSGVAEYVVVVQQALPLVGKEGVAPVLRLKQARSALQKDHVLAPRIPRRRRSR